MKIFNVRLGLANNSSSTHSIIFVGNKKISDYDVYDKDFGWNFFTAASKESREDYLALTLYYNLDRMCSAEMAAAIIKEWVGVNFSVSRDEWGNGVEGFIDHQSILTLPNDWDGKGIDYEFFQEFKAYLLQDGVVILGGNDNVEPDEHHPLEGEGKDILVPLPTDDASNPYYVARKDPVGNYWTIFNRYSGAKIRFSFDMDAPEPTKSYAPELVDIKITNYCPFGCEYCYMDSTVEGKHADKHKLRWIIDALANLKVFEVAFGGGEPTLYPDFPALLEWCRWRGIVPNFTTKSLHWIRDAGLRDKILRNVGSFAYSACDAGEVMSLASLINTYNIDRSKVSVQAIFGVTRPFELEQIMNICNVNNLRLTLLGYKDTGRGGTFNPRYINPRDTEYYFEVIKKARDKGICPMLAIDTLAASQYKDELEKLKIPRWLYNVVEGKFSMYIDAVEMKAGPCSYCDDSEYVDFEMGSADFWRGDNATKRIVDIHSRF